MDTIKATAVISKAEGGAELYIHSMCEQLRPGIDIDVQIWPTLTYNKMLGPLIYWYRSSKYVKNEHFIVNISNFFDVFKVAFLRSKVKQLSVIVHLNTSWRFFQFRLARKIFKWVIAKSDNVFLVSEAQRDLVQSANTIVVGSFLNTGFIQSDFSKCNREIDVAYIGRLTPEKGVDDLMRFIQQNPSLTVLIIGQGEQKYIEQLKKLEAAMPNFCYSGYVSQAELPAIYTNTRLVFQPSYLDTRSLQTQEAILCGCELLLYDVDGTRELAEEFGIRVVCPGNLSEVNEIATHLINDFDLPSASAARLARRRKLLVTLEKAKGYITDALTS